MLNQAVDLGFLNPVARIATALGIHGTKHGDNAAHEQAEGLLIHCELLFWEIGLRKTSGALHEPLGTATAAQGVHLVSHAHHHLSDGVIGEDRSHVLDGSADLEAHLVGGRIGLETSLEGDARDKALTHAHRVEDGGNTLLLHLNRLVIGEVAHVHHDRHLIADAFADLVEQHQQLVEAISRGQHQRDHVRAATHRVFGVVDDILVGKVPKLLRARVVARRERAVEAIARARLGVNADLGKHGALGVSLDDDVHRLAHGGKLLGIRLYPKQILEFSQVKALFIKSVVNHTLHRCINCHIKPLSFTPIALSNHSHQTQPHVSCVLARRLRVCGPIAIARRKHRLCVGSGPESIAAQSRKRNRGTRYKPA